MGWVGYLARKLPGYRVKEIAGYFRSSPVAVGEAITKIEGLLGKDKSFEKALKGCRKMWSRGRKENTAFPLPYTDLAEK